MTVESYVLGVVADSLTMAVDSLHLDMRFDELGVTSIDLNNIFLQIEEEYELSGLGRDAARVDVSTLGELVAFVQRAEEGAGTPPISAEVAPVRVGLASDHAGVELKSKIVTWLAGRGFEAVDFGPSEVSPVDYPSFAGQVSHAVAGDEVA